jgi:hypothetical protein
MEGQWQLQQLQHATHQVWWWRLAEPHMRTVPLEVAHILASQLGRGYFEPATHPRDYKALTCGRLTSLCYLPPRTPSQDN